MSEKSKGLWLTEILILLGSVGFASLFLTENYDEGAAAAGLLPNIVAAACILLAFMILTAEGISRRKLPRIDSSKAGRISTEEGCLLAWWGSYLAMAVYFLGILLIGFIGATLLYTLIIPFFMKYRKWKATVMASMIVTGCMYLAFAVILKIQLPTGILF